MSLLCHGSTSAKILSQNQIFSDSYDLFLSIQGRAVEAGNRVRALRDVYDKYELASAVDMREIYSSLTLVDPTLDRSLSDPYNHNYNYNENYNNNYNDNSAHVDAQRMRFESGQSGEISGRMSDLGPATGREPEGFPDAAAAGAGAGGFPAAGGPAGGPAQSQVETLPAINIPGTSFAVKNLPGSRAGTAGARRDREQTSAMPTFAEIANLKNSLKTAEETIEDLQSELFQTQQQRDRTPGAHSNCCD